MSVFEAVRDTVTVKEYAELNGFKPNKSSMICCPFHNDKIPSCKIDKRFYCFGCGAKGDTIDFVSRLYGIDKKSAAEKIADEFYIPYENNTHRKPIAQNKHKQEMLLETQFNDLCNNFLTVLIDYFRLMEMWEKNYSPHTPNDDFHPLFIRMIKAVHRKMCSLNRIKYECNSYLIQNCVSNFIRI
ncbi:MAG: DNA primase [Firmicutes bacterium]|nr:DNA primase [Bacillota bacterium]